MRDGIGDWVDYHIAKTTLEGGGNLTPAGWEWFRTYTLRWMVYLARLWSL